MEVRIVSNGDGLEVESHAEMRSSIFFEKGSKDLVIIRCQCPAEISPWRKFS